jgi:hypothetical protein
MSHKAYLKMQETPVVEEIKSSVDPKSIDWIQLGKKIAEEINNVRKNPKHLVKQMERSLSCFEHFKTLKVKGREIREFKQGAPAYIEALEFLETQKPVKTMKNSLNLKKAAQDHVNYLGETGKMTQLGEDGSNPKDRMEKYTGIDYLWSENLMFGGYKPKEIVEYMLVSDGDAQRGLRKNIFNPELKLMGVAVGPHPEGGSVTVVDFVSKELAPGELPTMQVEATDEIPEEMQKKLKDMGLSGKAHIQKGRGSTLLSMKKEESEIYGTEKAKPALVSLFVT